MTVLWVGKYAVMTSQLSGWLQSVPSRAPFCGVISGKVVSSPLQKAVLGYRPVWMTATGMIWQH
ncbi:hypothetical protein [Fundidesulfovibrio butyratiphilus]